MLNNNKLAGLNAEKSNIFLYFTHRVNRIKVFNIISMSFPVQLFNLIWKLKRKHLKHTLQAGFWLIFL